MLWRIPVGLARLLPSVRDIEVRREVSVISQAHPIEGAIFPEGWSEETPVSHYGSQYLKAETPILKASEFARKQVKMRFSKPYATITLRESSYWPTRNSSRSDWVKVADWLKSQNIQPVIVPDSEGTGFAAYGQYSEFAAASFDVDLRAALYEGAVVNLGVANGPMYLCVFLDCRYIIFNVGGGKEMAAGSSAFLEANGLKDGDELSPNGKWLWEPDIAMNIIPQLQQFTEKTSCQA